ncbi:deubiquitinating protein VCIP135-like, partial [Stegodyphus dumicola]
ELFKDFIDAAEWAAIIEECDPEFQPPEGELHGLRNIHIFGLANVLKRPIILLDSLECMKKCGDYSALFLPGFCEPCRGKDNALNKPICIAWSSYSHNHYIPLVGVQGKPLPVLPAALLPKVWGMPQNSIFLYIEFDANGSCTVGGSRALSDGYVQRLVGAMEVLFTEQNGIHPSLVADSKLFLFSDNGIIGPKTEVVIEKTKLAVQEGRLYRCLFCKALCELRLEQSWLTPGGALYNIIFYTYKKMNPDTEYEFPLHGISCKYDPVKDELVPIMSRTGLKQCTWCESGLLRKVTSDGTMICTAEDKSESGNIVPTQPKGLTYPEPAIKEEAHKINIKVQWNDVSVQDAISWREFQGISGQGLLDCISRLATNFIRKHFPGQEYCSELLAAVKEQILKQLSKPLDHKNATVLACSVAVKKEDESHVVKEEKTKYPRIEVSTSLNAVESSSVACQPQYVKVVSSDGKQANLTLSEKGISYHELQEWIMKEFHIPVASQRIKWGFPPKDLQASCDTNQMLPLKHGDRLIVEKIKSNEATKSLSSSIYHRCLENNIISEIILNKIRSELEWNAAKSKPEEFERGGSFYKQVAKSNVLHEKLHTSINYFPDKRFCYNPTSDRIELCEKQLGHFSIASDLEERIKEARRGKLVEGFSRCPLMSNQKEQQNNPVMRRPAISSVLSSREVKKPSLVRKGPGFSVLTSPESPDKMNIS